MLPLLRRWGEGRLDTLALVGAPRLTYYPFWRYEVAGRPRLVPAWPSLDPRWSEVAAPDGEQVVFDPAEVGEATLVEPAVEEAAARSRLPEATGAKPGELLHVPFFDAAVRCGALRFPVLVEASSGRVYAGPVPESMPGSRPAGTRLFLGGGLLLMTAEAALLPAWWLTVPTLAVTAAFVYWGLASGEQA